METPGNSLKKERERQHKSLTSIEKALNIHIEYLEAIENDHYEILPQEFFLKSYLRLYADSLGIDHNHILKLYENHKQEQVIQSSDLIAHLKGSSLPGFKKLFSWITQFKILLGGFIAVMLTILLVIWITYYKQDPPIDNVQIVPAPLVAKTDSLVLNITALNLTWVSVKSDDLKPKEWLLRPGEAITLSAHDKFTIRVGNAGGTKLTLNGKDVGLLGPNGKVVDLVLP